MGNQSGKTSREFILIILIVLSTVTALKDVVRIQSRRAQQQRIKTVRSPMAREVRL